MRGEWLLDPQIRFLNHGSFGACPASVLELQSVLREEMEREPVRFFMDALPQLAKMARERLAEIVRAEPDDLAFVPNATTAVNTVLRSLDFSPGDELVTTDHAYGACRNALEFVAERAGAKVVEAKVPFPLSSPHEVTDAILDVVTDRTRLALIDHITSPTALVWPIEDIVDALDDRGVDVLVDGAHAPGQVRLEVESLGAAYYTGNCHKWLCAPKGAAFLHVRRDRQERIRPLNISHGAGMPTSCGRSRFRLEFDWTGTDDPTPFLCIPAAADFLGDVDEGLAPHKAANRRLALEAQAVLASALGVDKPCPKSMVGAMAALPIPGGELAQPLETDPLQRQLFTEHAIEVPIYPWAARGMRLVRVSCQRYNRLEDYEALGEALSALLPSPGS